MASETREAVHSYLTDMLALEEHIVRAVRAQVEAHEEAHGPVVAELRTMEATIERHIEALRRLEDQREGDGLQGLGDAIKRAASTLAGFGAAAIDLVRTEKLAKNLRDDATAFSLAATGYLMLHTTAQALGDGGVADLAATHLRDYAQMIMRINHQIPSVVVGVLRDEDLPVDQSAAMAAVETYRQAWTA